MSANDGDGSGPAGRPKLPNGQSRQLLPMVKWSDGKGSQLVRRQLLLLVPRGEVTTSQQILCSLGK